MKSLILKPWPYIYLTLLVALVVSIIYYPGISGGLSAVLFVSVVGVSIYFAFQKHNGLYQQGQITRFKLACNIFLDLLGLVLTVLAASYLGGLAGTWASQYGLWTGLIVGVIVGFTSAWGVMKIWSMVFSALH